MPFRPDRLGGLMQGRNWDQQEFAEKLGVTQVTVSRYLSGKNPPSRETLERMASILDTSVSYLLGGDDQVREVKADYTIPSAVRLPVLGVIRAGLPICAQENIIDWEEIPMEYVKDGADYFFLRVLGNSMDRAYIPDGAHVLVRRQDHAENGQIVVAIVNQEDAALKRIRYLDDHIELVPESTRPQYKAQSYAPDEVRIIGVVERTIIRNQ